MILLKLTDRMSYIAFLILFHMSLPGASADLAPAVIISKDSDKLVAKEVLFGFVDGQCNSTNPPSSRMSEIMEENMALRNQVTKLQSELDTLKDKKSTISYKGTNTISIIKILS